MKKYLLSAALMLSMGATFAFGTDGDHLKGYIADAKCGASNMGSTAERIACTKKCIKGGSEAVLVVGDKIYKISNQKAVLKYAGKNVQVDGTVTNDSIEVTKIAEDKS